MLLSFHKPIDSPKSSNLSHAVYLMPFDGQYRVLRLSHIRTIMYDVRSYTGTGRSRASDWQPSHLPPPTSHLPHDIFTTVEVTTTHDPWHFAIVLECAYCNIIWPYGDFGLYLHNEWHNLTQIGTNWHNLIRMQQFRS